jgi:hypothetical protein
MRKYKYLTKPVKQSKKFIREMSSCVEKKYFMTLSMVIRSKKIMKLITEFNNTPTEDLTQTQVDIIDVIYQGCILIDDYNELFFKDIKVKFIDLHEFRVMQLKFPHARLHLKFNKNYTGG